MTAGGFDWVGGEIGMSAEPSMKKTDDPLGRSAGSKQLLPSVHQILAGNSIGITVFIKPFDLINAFPAPPAPCEAPTA